MSVRPLSRRFGDLPDLSGRPAALTRATFPDILKALAEASEPVPRLSIIVHLFDAGAGADAASRHDAPGRQQAGHEEPARCVDRSWSVAQLRAGAARP